MVQEMMLPCPFQRVPTNFQGTKLKTSFTKSFLPLLAAFRLCAFHAVLSLVGPSRHRLNIFVSGGDVRGGGWNRMSFPFGPLPTARSVMRLPGLRMYIER